MANVLKLTITGLEHFHPNYGKLIGTGKNNGIQVYEQLVKGRRILTSVKDGESVKQVVQTQSKGRGNLEGYEIVTTEAHNFVTNDRIKSVRGITTVGEGEGARSDIYRNVQKQDVNGNWDEFIAKYDKYASENAKESSRRRANAYMKYSHYDVESGKFVEYEGEAVRFANLKAGQRSPEMDAVWKNGASDGSIEAEQYRKAFRNSYYKTDKGYLIPIGKKPQVSPVAADYVLPNGAQIPAGETHSGYWVDNWNRAENRIEYYPNYSNRKMENNLGNTVFNFFDKLVCKLNGVKPPKAEG